MRKKQFIEVAIDINFGSHHLDLTGYATHSRDGNPFEGWLETEEGVAMHSGNTFLDKKSLQLAAVSRPTEI